MSLGPDAVGEARAAAARGNVAAAIDILDPLADDDSLPPGQRAGVLVELIPLLVTASRQGVAVRRARELERLLGVARLWPWASLLLARVIWLTRRVVPSRPLRLLLRVCLRTRKLEPFASFDAIRVAQLALYWDDFGEMPRLSLVQLAIAGDDREARLALAWLGYSCAYVGRALGIALLRRALAAAHAAHDRAMLTHVYALLAIAYQMCGRSDRSEFYHALFLRRYGSGSDFYRLLSLTNLLGVAFSRGDWITLRRRIEDCFAFSFALSSSRHHVQIYGALAILLTIEGRALEAEEAMATAEAAARANQSELDWMIYHRLAAYAALLAHQEPRARAHIRRGRQALAKCGSGAFYRRELDALERSLDGRDGGALEQRLHRAAYVYLRHSLASATATTWGAKVTGIARKLSAAIAGSFEPTDEQSFTVETLLDCLRRVFGIKYAITAPDLEAIKRRVLNERGVSDLGLAGGDLDATRIRCADGTLIVGMRAPTWVDTESLAVGVELPAVDVCTEPLFVGTLRLLLAQHSAVQSFRRARILRAKNARLEAIAQTTQMLAHDVRRPFTMLKAGFDAIRAAKSEAQMREIVEVLAPDLERSIQAADGLIADVMEFGRPTPVELEPVAPEVLIESSLAESFRFHFDAEITLAYDLRHRGAANVDRQRIARVFCNIVTNAIQATGRHGHIFFRTERVLENGRPMIAFEIRNTGSTIDPDELPLIFEAFYTKRRGGTGLGLAIAHRVVTAHGGQIGASSVPGGGVTFRFTLPASDARVPPPPTLPSHSGEIATRIATSQAPPSTREPVPPSDFEREVASRVAELTRPLRVVLVDDQALHRAAIRRQLRACEALDGKLEVLEAATSVEASRALDGCDLAVVDVDLGEADTTGLALVRSMRAAGSSAFVCVHSDSAVPETFQAALEAGADVIIPKPMTRAHLLKLVGQTALRVASERPAPAAAAPSAEVVLLDDSRAFLLGWRAALGDDVKLTFFRSPAGFWEEASRTPGFIDRLALVITDYRFDGIDDTGISFAEALRAKRADLPIFLSTSGVVFEHEAGGAVDKIIGKEPRSWPELERLMARAPSHDRGVTSGGATAGFTP